MATIDAAAAFTNSIRAEEITVANITKQVFSQTLQNQNTLMAHVKTWAVENTQNFIDKDFPSSFTRNEKQWGIDDGSLKRTKYERYSFGLENWHHMTALDITDTVDKAFDPIARLMTQLRYAEERLISQICLRAFVEPIKQVDPDPEADGGRTLSGGTGYIAAKIGVKRKVRQNFWYDREAALSDNRYLGSNDPKASTTAFGRAYHPLTTYAHIRHQFRTREVNVPLCILATPYLMRCLDLWNGETNFPYGKHAAGNQVVSPFEGNKYNDMGGLSSFMWQGFRHVCLYKSAMIPWQMWGDRDDSDNPYVTKAKLTSNDSELRIPVRDLSKEDVDRRTAKYDLPAAAGGHTAAAAQGAPAKFYTDGVDAVGSLPAATYVEQISKIDWITFVWSPMHLTFAYAPRLFLRGRTDTVIRLKDARFYLTRLNMGSVIIDEDYYLGVMLKVKLSA